MIDPNEHKSNEAMYEAQRKQQKKTIILQGVLRYSERLQEASILLVLPDGREHKVPVTEQDYWEIVAGNECFCTPLPDRDCPVHGKGGIDEWGENGD